MHKLTCLGHALNSRCLCRGSVDDLRSPGRNSCNMKTGPVPEYPNTGVRGHRMPMALCERR